MVYRNIINAGFITWLLKETATNLEYVIISMSKNTGESKNYLSHFGQIGKV